MLLCPDLCITVRSFTAPRSFPEAIIPFPLRDSESSSGLITGQQSHLYPLVHYKAVRQKNKNQYHNTIISSIINLNGSREAAWKSISGVCVAAETTWLAHVGPAWLPCAPSETG